MAMSQELVGFVKEGLQRGLPRAQIQHALLHAGWPAEQVTRGLAGFAEVEFPIPVPRPAAYGSAREAFTYVVLFMTLGLSAYDLGSLLFDLINRTFPDPGARLASQLTVQQVRWAASSLIVAFPVFLYVARLNIRAVRLDPTRRASSVRHQVTYLTLFIASCVLIGDFTTLVYNFLGGELTVRFILKVLTVAVIAGGVCGYYLWDLRGDEKEPE